VRVILRRCNNRGRGDQEEEMQPICDVNKQLNKRMSAVSLYNTVLQYR